MERTRDIDSAAGRRAIAEFDAFYDFAFPRVYRFARRRMDSEVQAEALCRLVLVRALTSLGGLGALDHRVHRDPVEFGFWLYGSARRTADRVEEHPELLDADLDLDDLMSEATASRTATVTSLRPTGSRARVSEAAGAQGRAGRKRSAEPS